MSEFVGLIENIKNNARNTYFIGIDKESGGLNDADHYDDPNIPEGSSGARHYAILQIAVIVYNGLFERLSKEPVNVIIYHSEEDLQTRVGEWSKKEFKDTLMIQCPNSSVTLEEAEKMIISHLNELGIEKGDNVYMLGNSIRLDFEFMSAQMKDLKSMFKYRLLDVSTFKTLFTTMYGRDITNFEKEGSHDALKDIEESVAELKFYLANFIRPLDEVIQLNEDKKKKEIVNKRICQQKKLLTMLNPSGACDGSAIVFHTAKKLLEWAENNNVEGILKEETIYKDILHCQKSVALIVLQFLSGDKNGVFSVEYAHETTNGKEVISLDEFNKALSNPSYVPINKDTNEKVKDYDYRAIGYVAQLRTL